MRGAAAGLGAVVAWLVCTGCSSTFSDPTGRENALEEAQRKYTQLVRWGEIEKASEFVDPDLRDGFLVHGPQLETIHITDYENGTLDYTDGDTATVTVTYRGYSIATLVEKSIREKQQWYREDGLANVWRVRSELPALLAELEGQRIR